MFRLVEHGNLKGRGRGVSIARQRDSLLFFSRTVLLRDNGQGQGEENRRQQP